MFAMLSTAWVVPGIIGPSLAALVGELTSWRWVFLGLLPLLLLAGAPALRALQRVEGGLPAADHEPARGARSMLLRAVAAAAGAGILVAALGASEPWLVAVGSVAGGAVLLPAFRSLTPPGTLRLAPGIPAAVLLRALMTFAFFASDAYIALLLQTWRGTPATLTGIVFTVTTVAWTGATWVQARRIERLGARFFVVLGFACIALGAVLTLPALLPSVPPAIAIATWALPGIGMGLMYSAVTLVVLRGAAPAEQGSAASSLQLADILGTALGTGIAGAMTAAGERAGADGLGYALGAVLAMSVLVSLLGIVASGRLGSIPSSLDRQAAAVD
jgi:MFS family permease